MFHNSIRKHGPDVWKHAVLSIAQSARVAKQLEARFIIEYKTFMDDEPGGYSMTRGGEGVVGLKHTQQTREAIGRKNRGRKHTSEARKAITRALTGRPCSKATREKMSASQKGKVITEECRQKLRHALKGRILNPETVAKIQASRAGYKHSDDTKRKIGLSNATYGKFPVVQCDLNGNEIQTFETILDAARAVHGKCARIYSVLIGDMKQHKCFVWKWAMNVEDMCSIVEGEFRNG